MDILLWLNFIFVILFLIFVYIEITSSLYWMKKGMKVLDRKLYRKYKKLGPQLGCAKVYDLCKVYGLKQMGEYEYFTPIYLPTDLELIRCILYNDFEYFTNRPFYTNETVDPLTAHLFLLNGKKWLATRKKITPAFTTGNKYHSNNKIH